TFLAKGALMTGKIKINYSINEKNIDTTHFHNDYEIIFVKKGSSNFYVGGKNYSAHENSLILLSNLEKHSMSITSTPYEKYVILVDRLYIPDQISSEIYSKIFQKRPVDFPYVFYFNKKVIKRIKEILNALMDEQEDDILTKEYSNVLLGELMILIYRSNLNYFNRKISDFDDIILNIQTFIAKNYSQEISLELMEKKFYISKFQISRSFKDVTGYNFKTYLILVRLSAAKDLLVHTTKAVHEITYEVGYSSENLFIRMFKQYEGMTPSKYRKNFKSFN
ncbi:MAG: AraC family transcriptional regulator, partial [Tissierellia bacterium]|nr:AraC family transcriptional regulator [Tissierellia bacterium]